MTLETAGAVVLVIGAISTLIGVIYKLRPESNKIFVDSATVAVRLADSGRDDLQRRLDAKTQECAEMERDHAQYRKDTGAHIAEQAAQIRGLRAELKHCEKERLRQQDGGAL